eukprot:336381-Prorocentrum_minimum.AAC.1
MCRGVQSRCISFDFMYQKNNYRGQFTVHVFQVGTEVVKHRLHRLRDSHSDGLIDTLSIDSRGPIRHFSGL